MTDQQRFDALSCHAGQAKTPNLDSLATTGVDLRCHYSQAPVCVPSRCSIFSGDYPHTHRILENDARLAHQRPHLFKVLRQADYWMAYHGKNHAFNDGEISANFNVSDSDIPIEESAEQTAYYELQKEGHRKIREEGSFASACFHDLPDRVTTTGRTANNAISALEKAPSNKPWCVVASFVDPHAPHLAPRRFSDLHPTEEMKLPPSPPKNFHEGKPNRYKIKYAAQNAGGATDQEKRKYLSVYNSMCSFVDDQVGRILQALENRPDKEETIIVFTSDHGDFCWERGLCKKDLVLYNDLLHVPAILSYPKQISPKVVDDTFTEHIDLMPTLLDLMELETPPKCQGRSMVPLLKGEASRHKDEVYAETCYPWMRNPYSTFEEFQTAWETSQTEGGPLENTAPFNVPGDYTKGMRTKEWSYNWYGDGFEELYDLRNDLREWHNLASDPDYKKQLHHFRFRLFEWLAKTADPYSPKSELELRNQFNKWNNVHSIK